MLFLPILENGLLRGSMVIDKAQQAWEERSKYA